MEQLGELLLVGSLLNNLDRRKEGRQQITQVSHLTI